MGTIGIAFVQTMLAIVGGVNWMLTARVLLDAQMTAPRYAEADGMSSVCLSQVSNFDSFIDL